MKKCKGMKYKALYGLVEHPSELDGANTTSTQRKEKVQAEIDLYATCYNLKG